MTSVLSYLLDDLLDTVAAYRWACHLDECDGRPHPGAPYDHARTKQRLPAGEWFIWLLLLGRGWGKTRTGAETFADLVLDNRLDVKGKPTSWLVAGPTFADTRDVCVEGPSGLLDAFRLRGITEENGRLVYDRSKWRLTIDGGARIFLRGGDQHNLAVGLNLAGAWLDEFGLWKRAATAWSQALSKTLRQVLPGTSSNRVIVTTTPRVEVADALRIMKGWIDRTDGSAVVTNGSTFENEHNLSPEYLAEILRDSPPGTRIYRQEVLGEITDDVVGALWTAELLEACHVDRIPEDVKVIRRLVTIDPATTSGPNSDETGMHLLAKTMQPDPERPARKLAHVYVEQDLTARVPAPEWARVAVETAVKWNADILYESDQGGDAWKVILKDAARQLKVECPRILTVRAASEGSKATRAQPVLARYYENRVHHVGRLPLLEDQMRTWVPEQTAKSPDRIDSVVYGVRELTKVSAVGPAIQDGW